MTTTTQDRPTSRDALKKARRLDFYDRLVKHGVMTADQLTRYRAEYNRERHDSPETGPGMIEIMLRGGVSRENIIAATRKISPEYISIVSHWCNRGY